MKLNLNFLYVLEFIIIFCDIKYVSVVVPIGYDFSLLDSLRYHCYTHTISIIIFRLRLSTYFIIICQSCVTFALVKQVHFIEFVGRAKTRQQKIKTFHITKSTSRCFFTMILAIAYSYVSNKSTSYNKISGPIKQ